MRLCPVLSLVLAITATTGAAAQTPITLDQAMAHPDWIGPPVESAWWSWDSRGVYFSLKRTGSPLRDVWLQALSARAGQLAQRYDRNLPDLMREADDAQARVAAHLARMGFAL